MSSKKKKSNFITNQEQLPGKFSETVPPGKDIVFSVFDDSRKAFTAPFLAVSVLQAKRFCLDQIHTSSTSFFALYPNTFTLYQVSTFDHSTGSFSQSPFGLKRIGTFADFLSEVNTSNSTNKDV